MRFVAVSLLCFAVSMVLDGASVLFTITPLFCEKRDGMNRSVLYFLLFFPAIRRTMSDGYGDRSVVLPAEVSEKG